MKPKPLGTYRPGFQSVHHCRFCGNQFLAVRKDAKTCSAACRKAWSRGLKKSMEESKVTSE